MALLRHRVVVVEAVYSQLRENVQFWQTLLSAELPPKKAGSIVREVCSQYDAGATKLDPISQLISGRLLSSGEQTRARQSDQTAMARALKAGAVLLHPDEYPDRLAEVEALPPVLMAWGHPEVLHRPTVGIVGTRSASSYGKACSQKFAEALARSGITIISGGAGGIDAHAHIGALDAGGSTVAVLPCGIDVAYPKAHENLYQSMREKGCLVSQFAAGKKPLEYDFLTRNSLIAALSDVLLIIEAPEKSGSLSTAKAALDLGREVLVVPGTIDRFGFKGSHQLIREGAILVDHPDHVLEVMGIEPGFAQPLQSANEIQEQIIQFLGQDPATAEVLASALEVPMTDLLGELTMLELEGAIIRDERGYALKP